VKRSAAVAEKRKVEEVPLSPEAESRPVAAPRGPVTGRPRRVHLRKALLEPAVFEPETVALEVTAPDTGLAQQEQALQERERVLQTREQQISKQLSELETREQVLAKERKQVEESQRFVQGAQKDQELKLRQELEATTAAHKKDNEQLRQLKTTLEEQRAAREASDLVRDELRSALITLQGELEKSSAKHREEELALEASRDTERVEVARLRAQLERSASHHRTEVEDALVQIGRLRRELADERAANQKLRFDHEEELLAMGEQNAQWRAKTDAEMARLQALIPKGVFQRIASWF
jgi:hypothetical protein